MSFEFKKIDEKNLAKYRELFTTAFPNTTHIDEDYLKWLYFSNPEGDVVGFDAFYEGVLAAHYACVPIKALFFGDEKKGLLSLNTATHPNFQGKGLFTQLAGTTFKYAQEHGYDFVIGVANQNSTHGFVKKLGFQLVQPLKAALIIGKVKKDQRSEVSFKRLWSEATIRWRLINPKQEYKLSHGSVFADTAKMGIECFSFIDSLSSFYSFYPKLFIGLMRFSKGLIEIPIPERLKPSPLNLIFLDLKGQRKLNPNEIELQFIDFDAY